MAESNTTVRKPTTKEIQLISFLAEKSGLHLPNDWSEKLIVKPMDDGNMGSLLLFPDGKFDEKRTFGNQNSEFLFKDLDQVDVIVSLNLDKNGKLYELDFWKTDFSPLLSIPFE